MSKPLTDVPTKFEDRADPWAGLTAKERRESDRRATEIATRLPGPPKGRGSVLYSDPGAPGLGLRVTSAGARTWTFRYRARGSERRLAIGSLDAWDAARARDEARTLRRLVDGGGDPAQARTEERGLPTVGELCDLYIKDHLPTKRPTSQRDDLSMIEAIIKPKLKNHRVANVTTAQIRALHSEITAAEAPIRANRVLSLLSMMFSLAIATSKTSLDNKRWHTENPVKGIPKNAETKRKHYLSSADIARLTKALAASPSQSANIITLLLLTGARRGEVLGATWSQFDKRRGFWVKPAHATKQKAEHEVPLGAEALELLAKLRKAAGKPAPTDLVFPGVRSSVEINLQRTWIRLCRQLKIENIRVHDLRHSFASILVSQGYSLPIIGALLGHNDTATTARYAHLYPSKLKEAADQVGAAFKGGKVIPLHGKRRG